MPVTTPVIIGLQGLELNTEERELLQHPLLAGVILFSRNFESVAQLSALTHEIKSLRTALLIAVDHEGGRVQRFREGFTTIPAMRQLGQCYEQEANTALQLAHACGWLLASELRAVGIDFSFTPVLDLDYGCSPAIGNRALHHDPVIVIQLATALIQGLKAAGCCAVGKHFPGHGAVTVDSHHGIPVDERDLGALQQADLIPFQMLLKEQLTGVMPGHLIFPQCDPNPAGFSKFWLQTILRQELGFTGVIISDDLDMAGAAWAGSASDRTQLALAAGCDLVLACNNRSAACEILDHLPQSPSTPLAEQKLASLRPTAKPAANLPTLQQQPRWQQARTLLERHNLI